MSVSHLVLCQYLTSEQYFANCAQAALEKAFEIAKQADANIRADLTKTVAMCKVAQGVMLYQFEQSNKDADAFRQLGKKTNDICATLHSELAKHGLIDPTATTPRKQIQAPPSRSQRLAGPGV